MYVNVDVLLAEKCNSALTEDSANAESMSDNSSSSSSSPAFIGAVIAVFIIILVLAIIALLVRRRRRNLHRERLVADYRNIF